LPTIRDVAKRAGVAISTASAALNRSAPVSDEVIRKVEIAVRETGYVPHAAAQSLRIGQSRLIGLILPDITNPHFASVAQVVESACLKAGYLAAVYSTNEDFDRERQILRMMRAQRVAGLIIISTRTDFEHGEQLAEQVHVPAILLDSHVMGLPYDVVKLDNVLAARLATDYLLDLGHRRIAVVTGRANTSTGEDRLRGYLDAHAARNLPVEPALQVQGQFLQSVAYQSTLALMRSDSPPTGILALSNMMTLGVMTALHDLKVKIPSDISVIGLDDFTFANIMNPPPTVVAAPIVEMAQAAIDRLFEEIAGKSKPEGKVEQFTPKLIVRKSCKSHRAPAAGHSS
jgi:DNA-binding LacI/PurR family transcriptional regulator